MRQGTRNSVSPVQSKLVVTDMNTQEIKNYLLRGGAWAFAGKLATSLSGLVLAGLLARLLSPSEMGIYFLAFNLATFFSILGRSGLENTLMRLIAQANGAGQWGTLQSIYAKGTTLVLICAIMAGLAAALSVPYLGASIFNSTKLSEVSWIVGGWSALLAIQFTIGEVFRGYQKIATSVWAGGLATAILTLALLGAANLIGYRLGLTYILFIVLAALVLNNCLALYLQDWLIKHRPNDTGNSVGYGELLNQSWPLLINAATVFLLSQSDLWLLGSFATEQDLAIYGAASRLVMLTAMSLAIVNKVVPPLIARLHAQNDMPRLEKLLRSVATLSAIPALTTLAIFMFFAAPIMGIVFGAYYEAGAQILQILCFGQVVNVLVGSCGYVLIMTGHRKSIMTITLISAGIALVLGTILMQTHGVIGLAFGYATATIIQQLAMWLVARWRCGIWTHTQFLNFNLLKFS